MLFYNHVNGGKKDGRTKENSHWIFGNYFSPVPWGAAAQKQVKAIVGGTLVNPDGVKPLRDSIILIEDSRIVKVGTGKQVKIPATAEVIHAEGKWIIPGLVDTHIHFFQSGGLYTRPDVIDLRKYVPYQEQELAQIRLRLQDTFERYLRCGITSVVDVGGPFWNFAVRDLAAKTVRAPRVLVAGPLISTYQPEALTTDDPPILKVNTVEEAQALVRKQIARKTDLIKIWYIVQPGQKPEDFFALVRETVNESHRHGVRVAVHATGLETARKAVEAGADILVHDINDREVDPAFVALLKQRKVILTPTLIVFQRYSEVLSQQIRLNPWEFKLANPYVISSLFDLRVIPAEDISERVKERIRSIATPVQTSPIVLKNLKILQEAGVTIAAGTDAGNIGTLHGPSLFREFELMRDAGLSPRQILADATLNGARFMAREQELGSIAAKKLADLVILNADPLEDIRNLGNVYATVKNGNVFLASQLAVDFGCRGCSKAGECVQRQGYPGLS